MEEGKKSRVERWVERVILDKSDCDMKFNGISPELVCTIMRELPGHVLPGFGRVTPNGDSITIDTAHNLVGYWYGKGGKNTKAIKSLLDSARGKVVVKGFPAIQNPPDWVLKKVRAEQRKLPEYAFFVHTEARVFGHQHDTYLLFLCDDKEMASVQSVIDAE